MTRELQLQVRGGFDAIAERVARAWHRAARGETVREEHLTFASWEALAKVMTAKRLELLRHLHCSPAASIAALARALGRDYKSVHEDVEALQAAGLLDRDEAGLRVGYDELRAVVVL